MLPRTTSLSSIFFLSLWDHEWYVVYLWKIVFRSCTKYYVCGVASSWPLLNSFNNTEAAFFPCRLFFPRTLNFFTIIIVYRSLTGCCRVYILLPLHPAQSTQEHPYHVDEAYRVLGRSWARLRWTFRGCYRAHRCKYIYLVFLCTSACMFICSSALMMYTLTIVKLATSTLQNNRNKQICFHCNYVICIICLSFFAL